MTQTEDRSGDRTTKRTSSRTSKQAGKQTSSRSNSNNGSTRASSGRTAKKQAAAKAEPPRRPSGRQVAAEAARQLVELTGKEPEGIVGLERTGDGWTVEVEVLELRRVPSTTDVLATYAVAMDEQGELEGYQRRARYVRGAAGED